MSQTRSAKFSWRTPMSKLVKKAAEHAARKQKAQYTLKPNQLDENTVNRLIGFSVITTIISVVALLLAIARN
jgi:hypothetical protein